jgi:hypothetical protein
MSWQTAALIIGVLWLVTGITIYLYHVTMSIEKFGRNIMDIPSSIFIIILWPIVLVLGT